MSTASRHSAYLFEAKGIQRWIFAAGKLRDIIGASDLLSGLARSDGDDVIGAVLHALGVRVAEEASAGVVAFSRRAGGAFCLHGDRDVLQRVRAQWRLLVMTMLPGLEFADGFGDAAESPLAAMRDAYAKAGGPRENHAARVLPLGQPVHLYAPLTGRPATTKFTYPSRGGDDAVLADAITEPQRRHAERLQTAHELDGVARRMLGEAPAPATNRRWAFPRNLDWRDGDTLDNPLFPFRRAADDATDPERVQREPADQRIAIVHADLSGLGQAFRSLGSGLKTPRDTLELATRIEHAIVQAVQNATAEVLAPAAIDQHGALKLIPARPIVIGGDDITIIVRADLALRFAERLLAHIESETRRANVGEGLSATAGVAIVGKGLPYLTAYELADSLCAFAKAAAKAGRPPDGGPYPSAIAFHHQTQTAHECYQDILPSLLDDARERLLTANPYALDERSAGPMGVVTIGALKNLAQAIANLPGAAGALRELHEHWLASRGTARARWQRLREVAQRRNPQGLQRLDDALREIHITADKDSLPELARRRVQVDGRDLEVTPTPLFDALVMLDVGAVVPDGAAQAPVADAA